MSDTETTIIPKSVKHTYWVGDAQMRQSNGDLRRWVEEGTEREMLAYVREHFGIDPVQMHDICHHRWYDMDDPLQLVQWFGLQAGDGSILPPARWMLYSEWHIKYPSVAAACGLA